MGAKDAQGHGHWPCDSFQFSVFSLQFAAPSFSFPFPDIRTKVR